MKREFTSNKWFLVTLFVIFASLPAGKLWAPLCDSSCLQACYNHLTSGDFHIQGNIEGEASIRITNALANKVMDLIQDEGDSAPGKSEKGDLTAFDQLVKTITKNQEGGHWILDDTSDQILNACYDAAHTEKE
jgi:hypothetical protein